MLNQLVIDSCHSAKNSSTVYFLSSSSLIDPSGWLPEVTIGISSGNFLVLKDALVIAVLEIFIEDIEDVGDKATFIFIDSSRALLHGFRRK